MIRFLAYMRRMGASCGAILPGAILVSFTVAAEIPDYQLLRIIAYQTNCRLDELRSEDLGEAGVRFHATCLNLNAYPDGLILNCADPSDAHACDIATEERRFDVMEDLRNQVNSGM